MISQNRQPSLISFSLISWLNIVPNVEECDATDDDQRVAAGNKKYYISITLDKLKEAYGASNLKLKNSKLNNSFIPYPRSVAVK